MIGETWLIYERCWRNVQITCLWVIFKYWILSATND